MYRRQPGRVRTRIATRTGMNESWEERRRIHKRKTGESARGVAALEGRRYLYPGHIHWITDGRFLCFLVGRFTEHFRRTDLIPARCRPGSISVLRVYGRSDGLLARSIWEKGGYRKQPSSQGFFAHHKGFPFSLFFFFFISSFLTHTSIPHHKFPPTSSSFPRNTTCTTFHTSFDVNQRVPPWGQGPGPAWCHRASTLEYHR